MGEIIPIICGSTLFFGTILLIIFGFFGYLRWVRYKETLALAEKGLLRADMRRGGRGTLYWGIAISALGLAITLGLYSLGWYFDSGQFPLRFGPWMVFGLIPLFFGLALVLIYILGRREDREDQGALPPILPPAPPAPGPLGPDDADEDTRL